MLKRFYNYLPFVLIIIGIILFLTNEIKNSEKIYSFEINNYYYGGKINQVETKNTSNGYLGILEIPKIDLYQGFFEYGSPLNTVDKNIEVIETSKMPDIQNSNLILAAHSGTSDIAYFKHLDELSVNDTLYIYYNNKKYKYVINDIYDKNKTGYIEILRNKEKTTLTLITCKKNTNMQTVFIGYLVN